MPKQPRVTFDTSRLVAFTDGVVAVIITIIVLDIKAPHGTSLRELVAIAPALVAYVSSFIYVAIYWANHHHLMQATKRIDSRVLWANLHLLFWLSLVPFATTWVGENPRAPLATAAYSATLLLAALAYVILINTIVAVEGSDSPVATETKNSRKDLASLAVYVLAVGLAFFATWASDLAVIAVALIWLVPDPRMERAMVKR